MISSYSVHSTQIEAMCRLLTVAIVVFLHVQFTISGDSASRYHPVEDIAINCGSSGKSTALDGREWTGDVRSIFNLWPQPKGKSTSSQALHHYLSADPVPYMTARISRSQFTYTFHLTPGPKFIRLHFYPSSYFGFHVSKSFFRVKAGPYTLLSNFSASLTADSLGAKYLAKEFCVNVDDNQSLSISFSPSEGASSQNIYAFINGIEIVSMPTGLYYSLAGDLGAPIVGGSYRLFVDNRTLLEMVYRLNMGGRSILPVEDLGMYRSWSVDSSYLLESSAISIRSSTKIKYRSIPSYIAPLSVYQTAWSVGPKELALTWKLPVNLGYRYLVRLHFCELESGVTKRGQRVFTVVINNQIAEIDADVIKWSGGSGFPVYREYVVMMKGDKAEGKRDIIVALHPKPSWKSVTRKNYPLLSGLEIFKLSNLDDSLAEPNPPPSAHALTSGRSKLKRSVLAFGSGKVFAACVTLALTLANIVVYQLNQCRTNSGKRNKTSSPKDKLCPRFSLAEIELATNNFDDEFVIGNGGFGKVYKGSINPGAKIVAIKRLKLESEQGAREFWTEIEMLSNFRYVHLVSLIGYCHEGQEMLLAYEYMANGSLADHLYKVRDENGNSPLSWEQRLRICIGAARGLNYLHTNKGAHRGLIHRDVKSSNILLDENLIAKISDFGLSKLDATNLSRTHMSTEVKGTFGYLDPEYLMTHKLTKKTDIYAFGVVLFEVLCGRPAVDTSLVEEQHSLVLWARQCIREGRLKRIVDPSLREQISKQSLNTFAEIANKCSHKSPSERPTMAVVVRSLELELERHGSAHFDTDRENIEVEGTNVPVMRKKDNASRRGPTRGWWWDLLWRRGKPSKASVVPYP